MADVTAVSPGYVYVFNATTNLMTLTLNAHPVPNGTLYGTTQSSNYKPNPAPIKRVSGSGNPQVAQFGGQNQLVVSFPTGGSQQYEVDINATLQNQLGLNLQLYIFYTAAVLVWPGQQQTQQGQAQVLVPQSVSREPGETWTIYVEGDS
ncbi:MAG TPA: hypothetical protein VEX13_08430 [Chloroflexia bacterium]|nr:hypothetical protein [Chloroflexia bacterium]